MNNAANDPMEFLNSVWKDPRCHMIDRIRCAQLVVNLTLEKERHDRISACVDEDVEFPTGERLWNFRPWILYAVTAVTVGMSLFCLWRSVR